jgi:hypothetical protein
MADPPPQSNKARNPNWGGRREGSGRKKGMAALPRAPGIDSESDPTCMYRNPSFLFFFSLLSASTDTTQTQNLLPVNASAPARGFFAARNRFQDSSTTLHPTVSISNGTDGEQMATNEENGPLIVNNSYSISYANYIKN